MKKLPIFLLALTLAVGFVSVLPTPLTAEEQDLLDELDADLDSATTVIVAVVRGAKPTKNSSTDVITTTVTAQATVTLKGVHSTENRTFDVEGGTVGDLTMHVSHIPLLEPGDRILVLLDENGDVLAGRTIFKVVGNGNNIDETSVTISDVQGLL